MKKHLALWMAALLLVVAAQAQQYTFGTYNLRYDNPGDTGNRWVNRAPVVAALIQFHDFDVLGTQEGLLNQLDDLSKALPAYNRYGLGRDDGKDAGEHSAIFYKKDKFELLQKGDFWLSETPDQPTLGWDATCCKRICSWVQLKDKKSGKSFFFFNAHYDHQGVKARIESSKLVLARIKAIAGSKPVVFTGDLNGGHETDCYKIIATSTLLQDSYTLVSNPYVNNGSFNGFGHNLQSNELIDHVFVTKQFSVTRYGVLTDTYRGKFSSDHCPVLVNAGL
ncbi:endonuclease/exonuclease/phosphatase family protein [Deminuibacter soli]|uniref:Endonuclease n=1 Tax=Deminuibacter soli TaxID=2291815 RepID=A0A3E1ND04_9BACT|nr:endonuclease/exonuclease/phosphatase family protein [Deminuibacter soli]RFM25721.1 endonuclease [Deminuibacter soli]